jgi:endonuclease III
MPDTTIQEYFGVSETTAVEIRNAKPEQLINSDKICPQHIKGIKHKRYKCLHSEDKCKHCIREFLESEVEKE